MMRHYSGVVVSSILVIVQIISQFAQGSTLDWTDPKLAITDYPLFEKGFIPWLISLEKRVKKEKWESIGEEVATLQQAIERYSNNIEQLFGPNGWEEIKVNSLIDELENARKVIESFKGKKSVITSSRLKKRKSNRIDLNGINTIFGNFASVNWNDPGTLDVKHPNNSNNEDPNPFDITYDNDHYSLLHNPISGEFGFNQPFDGNTNDSSLKNQHKPPRDIKEYQEMVQKRFSSHLSHHTNQNPIYNPLNLSYQGTEQRRFDQRSLGLSGQSQGDNPLNPPKKKKQKRSKPKHSSQLLDPNHYHNFYSESFTSQYGKTIFPDMPLVYPQEEELVDYRDPEANNGATPPKVSLAKIYTILRETLPGLRKLRNNSNKTQFCQGLKTIHSELLKNFSKLREPLMSFKLFVPPDPNTQWKESDNQFKFGIMPWRSTTKIIEKQLNKYCSN